MVKNIKVEIVFLKIFLFMLFMVFFVFFYIIEKGTRTPFTSILPQSIR